MKPTKSKTRKAPGHNPDKLTVEQVGKGWRLLSAEERLHLHPLKVEQPAIRAWCDGEWSKRDDFYGSSETVTYRTRKPPGYFLPKLSKEVMALHQHEKVDLKRPVISSEPTSRAKPPRPTDTQLMDILSSLWDSQGDGAKVCGRFFPNPTGSFRAAVASFYENEIKKAKR